MFNTYWLIMLTLIDHLTAN